jgi:hypothetical protein
MALQSCFLKDDKRAKDSLAHLCYAFKVNGKNYTLDGDESRRALGTHWMGAERAPELVCRLRRREKYLAPASYKILVICPLGRIIPACLKKWHC